MPLRIIIQNKVRIRFQPTILRNICLICFSTQIINLLLGCMANKQNEPSHASGVWTAPKLNCCIYIKTKIKDIS